MEMYKQAYKRYSEKCKKFGIGKIDMSEFSKNVTEEQAEMIVNEA